MWRRREIKIEGENNKNCEIVEEAIKKLRKENNRTVEEEEDKK